MDLWTSGRNAELIIFIFFLINEINSYAIVVCFCFGRRRRKWQSCAGTSRNSASSPISTFREEAEQSKEEEEEEEEQEEEEVEKFPKAADSCLFVLFRSVYLGISLCQLSMKISFQKYNCHAGR